MLQNKCLQFMKETTDTGNSYKSILKGTSVFGGVQIFQIGINLIRGKFVAMFLGPTGMGISSLFSSSGQTIQQLAGLGLNLGIVKEVAAQKDKESFGALLTVTKYLILFTSLLGALACVALAMPLSRITFGSPDYSWQFMLLGAMIFFGVAGQGYLSILQGLHAVKLISVTTITGSLAGLIVGVPLYYLWGDKGIVPAMVILSFSTLTASFIGVKKAIKTPKVRFDRILHSPIVKKLFLMGIVLVAADVVGSGCTYTINLFIRNFGALENVGLFQAANSVTNQYSGVVFTAMMLDFFPRLSEAADDNGKIKTIVNRQIEIVALIACPLICLLILTSPLIITILLTDTFLPIVDLMRWLGVGVLIKALMYPLGYIAFAKDNRKLFFWLEGVYGNLMYLILSCLGYYFFGLIGLGYSLIIDCVLCFVVYYAVNRRLYRYNLSSDAILEGIVAVFLVTGCFALSFISNQVLAYSLMSGVTLVAIVRSAMTLRRKIR